MPRTWLEIPGMARAIGTVTPIIVGQGYVIVPILKSISKSDDPDHYRVYYPPLGNHAYIGQAPTPRAAKELAGRHDDKTSKDQI